MVTAEPVGQVCTKARAASLITLAAFAWTLFRQAVPGTATYLVGFIPLPVGFALLILSELILRPGKSAA